MKIQVNLSVELQEYTRENAWPAVTAYIVGRSGRLLARQAVEQNGTKPQTGAARFEFDAPEPPAAIQVGPNVEEFEELARQNPVVQRLALTPGGTATVNLVLPKAGWWCWIRVPYLVTGTVEKQESDHRAPICWGEVDVYDVDLGYCFPRLSDAVIERLRDGLVDLILDPPPVKLQEAPWWPRWERDDPGDTPRPTPEIDIRKKLAELPPEWGLATKRLAALDTSRRRMSAALAKMPLEKRTAWLGREAVAGVRIGDILQSNTAQLRQLLAAKFLAFRFWLCWYPWIYWLWWPWCWYSLEKLGTATLQPGGQFWLTVWLSVCRNDVPDLWFVVRQKINGVSRVIYARHPVPCNTFWDNPSGKKVYLLVTDPLAVSCQEPPGTDLDPTHYWILPLAIGNYSLKRIYGTGAGNDAAKIGLYKSITSSAGGTINTFQDGPFGGMVGLRVLFSYALLDAGVKYYRIKSRVNGSGAWSALTHEVVRHYSHYDPVTDTLSFPAYPLGPKTVGPEAALFEIPPKNPPPAPAEAWYPIDATVDLMSGYFDTTDAAPGYVEFKLELFDATGARLNPPAVGAGISFKLPDTEDVWGTVTTANASAVNAALVANDPENAAFQTFVFRLQIDNRAPLAQIDEPTLPSGAKVGPCGVINYAATDATVTMPYHARHPARFAMYRFALYRPGGDAPVVQEGQVGDLSGGSFSATASVVALRTVTKDDGTVIVCPMVALSENLYIWNMAFNGWSRVGPDASAVRPFALAPAAP